MAFTTFDFIVFLFLVFILYYLLPKKFQWVILLVASYVFYAFAGIEYLLYILVTTISTFLIARVISNSKDREKDYLKRHKGDMSREDKKAFKAKNKSKQWKWLLLCLILNFGILGVLKYTNFMIQNINNIFSMELGFFEFAVPLGISYYTFMTMGYAIDVYRGKYPAQTNIFKFALFASFFPQLVQGPIARYDQLSQTLYNEHRFDLKQVHFGLQRVLWGYFKKMVVADRILVACKTIFGAPEEYTGLFVLIGLIFYSIDIYADFTGGIDITIGVAQMFGIQLDENFDRPYASRNLAEFWRRWHITMGTWFKDYVFYPISVCKPMLKLSKWSRKHLGDIIGKRLPVYLATLVVWFLTGVWHGAAWSFIAWGLANAIVILISQELDPLYKMFHNRFNVEYKGWYIVFQMVRTFMLVTFLRVFDCYGDVALSFKMLGEMITNMNLSILFDGSLLNIGLTLIDYIILIIGVIFMFLVSHSKKNGSVREQIDQKNVVVKFAIYYVLIFAIILLGAYGIGYDASSFIYNQF